MQQSKYRTETSFSPMMIQYQEIKQQHPESLLFFRMGDFYELFFEDAKIASSILNIVLTKRQNKNMDIPMCGIPYHSYESYLNRLIIAGYKVAICEQTETPEEAKKRGYKAVVNREVLRVITPGTITEDSLLDNNSYNYIASVFIKFNKVFVAWLDISTGDFYIESSNLKEINNILFRISPKELLIASEQKLKLSEEWHNIITPLFLEDFNFSKTLSLLESVFNNKVKNLLNNEEIIVCGALLGYINSTQKGKLPRVMFPKLWEETKIVRMDFFTRKSLELEKKLNGSKNGSLKSTIDFTMTSAGSRLLGEWINSPLNDINYINLRLEVVNYFVQNNDILNDIKNKLKNIPDIERILSRITLNRGTPKDLGALNTGLQLILIIKEQLFSLKLPELLNTLLTSFGNYSNIQEELARALLDDLPVSLKDGGVIKHGYKPEIDFLKGQSFEATRQIANLQSKYSEELQISNLKIQYNGVLGYFIEVPSKLSKNLKSENGFLHKQTLANNARFTTKELMDLEANVIRVKDKIIALEQKAFNDLVNKVIFNKEIIFSAARAIATLDVLCSFASASTNLNFVCPVVNNTKDLIIEEGRHPVVENSLRKLNEDRFIANDCCMDSNSNIFIITGPNMAGKSTFLRQNAIIIILAQMGCFVPAKSATIGIVDAIFSRVGAADDLYKGQSTFMVEMIEASIIVNNATEKSFIILDEIGRGTATYDGLSIAAAIIEYLHEINKSRVLFATHYHELTKMQNKLSKVSFYHVEVEEWENEIIFMHKVSKGVSSKSYGVHVAKLAGMPKSIIKRANKILNSFENISNNELPLFSSANDSSLLNEVEINNTYEYPKNIKNALDMLYNINPDEMSAREALDFLYIIKQELSNIK